MERAVEQSEQKAMPRREREQEDTRGSFDDGGDEDDDVVMGREKTLRV